MHQRIESSGNRFFGDAFRFRHPVNEIAARNDVARARVGDQTTEQRDRRRAFRHRKSFQLLNEEILEQPLHFARGEQLLGLFGQPKHEARDLAFGRVL